MEMIMSNAFTRLLLIVVPLVWFINAQAQMPALPAPTGPYAVGTTVRHLIDEARDSRELMIQIWYPAEEVEGATFQTFMPPETIPALAQLRGVPEEMITAIVQAPTPAMIDVPVSEAQSTYPVILFSPGYTETRFSNTSQMLDLASHGYIVVGIDHTDYATAVVFPDGRVKTLSPEVLTPEAVPTGLLTFIADQRFVLDQLEMLSAGDALLANRLDLEHLGAFGHSSGGAVAALTCSQDERCDAAINMDGRMDLAVYEGIVMNVPFMLLTQDFPLAIQNVSEEMLAAAGMTREDYEAIVATFVEAFDRVFTAATRDTYRLRVEGSMHESFADQGLFLPIHGAEIEQVRMLEVIRAYTLAFFDTYLRDQPSPLLDGPSPEYPEVRWISTPESSNEAGQVWNG
jgi:pimeloyl-ACP methyl ester carboxylesterase